jgi:hypothetical protein
MSPIASSNTSHNSRPTSRPNSHFKDRGPKKVFQNKGTEIRTRLTPGDPFIFQDSFRPKKSFPFFTPSQALKKFLGLHEERAKPNTKETLRVIPF